MSGHDPGPAYQAFPLGDPDINPGWGACPPPWINFWSLKSPNWNALYAGNIRRSNWELKEPEINPGGGQAPLPGLISGSLSLPKEKA